MESFLKVSCWTGGKDGTKGVGVMLLAMPPVTVTELDAAE